MFIVILVVMGALLIGSGLYNHHHGHHSVKAKYHGKL